MGNGKSTSELLCPHFPDRFLLCDLRGDGACSPIRLHKWSNSSGMACGHNRRSSGLHVVGTKVSLEPFYLLSSEENMNLLHLSVCPTRSHTDTFKEHVLTDSKFSPVMSGINHSYLVLCGGLNRHSKLGYFGPLLCKNGSEKHFTHNWKHLNTEGQVDFKG